MSKTVLGVFESEEQASMAAEEIRSRGLKTDQISILSKANEKNSLDGDAKEVQGRAKDVKHEKYDEDGDGKLTKGKTRDNISDGVISGGALGGIAGFLAGAGTIAIPGLGILAAAGPVTGMLSGLAAGGLIGGLIDLGIPEPNSSEYESYIRNGKVLFTMKTGKDHTEEIVGVLRDKGAYKVEVH